MEEAEKAQILDKINNLTPAEKSKMSFEVMEQKLFDECSELYQQMNGEGLSKDNESRAYARIGIYAYGMFKLKNNFQ